MNMPASCVCGREAVWSLAIADASADDFRIRPDLCHVCYLRLPPAERTGWQRTARSGLRTHRDEAVLAPGGGSGDSRPYLLAVEGRAVFVSVAVNAPGSPNPAGLLTADILESVTLLAQHRAAAERESPDADAPPMPRPSSVHVADTSAPFQMALLTDEQARHLLAPEDFADLMQVLDRQRRNK